MGELSRPQEAFERSALLREYRRAAHTVYALHFLLRLHHKYRKPVLPGERCPRFDLRDLPEPRHQDFAGPRAPDHVHLLFSAAVPGAVLGHAGDQRKDVQSSDGLSTAANGVLGSADCGHGTTLYAAWDK